MDGSDRDQSRPDKNRITLEALQAGPSCIITAEVPDATPDTVEVRLDGTILQVRVDGPVPRSGSCILPFPAAKTAPLVIVRNGILSITIDMEGAK